MKEQAKVEPTTKEVIPDGMKFHTPEQPAFGQNAAKVTIERDAPGGGARPIAEQPGVAPDYQFQGLPPDNSKETVNEPTEQSQKQNLFDAGGVMKTDTQLAREKAAK